MKTRVTQTESRPFHRGVEMQGLKEKEEEVGLVTTEKPGSAGRDVSLPPTLTAKGAMIDAALAFFGVPN